MATKQTTTAEDGAGPVDVAGTVLTTAGPEPSATFRAFTPLTAEGAGRYNVEFTMMAPGAGELVRRVRLMTGEMDKAGWTPAYGYAGPGQNGQNGAHAAGRSDGPPMATGSGGPVGLATGVMSGTGEGGGVIPAAWYVVAPEPGGKERVSFWNVSRDYAEISMVKPVGGSAPLFVNVGPTEFGEHRIPVNVHFTWGKDRGKGDGSRYRDVVKIERAA